MGDKKRQTLSSRHQPRTVQGGGYLNFETESYTSLTGALVDWVNVPSVSTGTIIYACYDASSVTTDQSHPSSTWNANYTSVYHYADNTASTSVYESTKLGNTGALQSTTASRATSTQIDGGFWFNGSSDNMSFASTSPASLPTAASPITESAWVETTSTGVIFGGRNAGNSNTVFDITIGLDGYLAPNLGQLSLIVRDDAGLGIKDVWVSTSTPIDDGKWHYVVVTRTSGKVDTIYQDGKALATTTDTMTNPVTPLSERVGVDVLNAGLFPMLGDVDEVNFLNVALSPSWILTEYNNQISPDAAQSSTGFYAVGAQTSFGGGSTPVFMAFTWLDEDD